MRVEDDGRYRIVDPEDDMRDRELEQGTVTGVFTWCEACGYHTITFLGLCTNAQCLKPKSI